MQGPEENKNSSSFDVIGDGAEAGVEIVLEGLFMAGEYLGDATGGLLDGISIDI